MANLLDVIRKLLSPGDELSRGQAGSPTGSMLDVLMFPRTTPGGGNRLAMAGGPDGDRLTDAPTDRINQAFDAVAGGPESGPTREQIVGYMANRGQQPAPVPTPRPEIAAPVRQAAPVAAPRAAPARDPYLAWQRGLGSDGADNMPAPQMAGSASQPSMVGGGGQDRLEGSPAPSGGGFLQGLFGQGQGAQQKLAAQYLQRQGMDGGMAQLVANDPQLLRAVVGKQLAGGGANEFAQRASAAEQYGLDPASEEGRNFILSGKLPDAKGGAAEVGLQPLYGVDKDNNPVVFQLSKNGEAILTRMPDGVTVAKNPIEVKAGRKTILIDPITRQVAGEIDNDIAGAEAEKASGKATGEAAFDLPRVEDNATLMLGVLDRMKQHPGREGSTGFVQGLLPSRTSDQVDFQSLVDQTQGQAFLQAYQTLKGGGQITEVEGAKAERALSRLGNQRLSDEDYLRAISDFEDVVNLGLARARKQAGVSAPASGEGWNDVGNGVRIRRKQ